MVTSTELCCDTTLKSGSQSIGAGACSSVTARNGPVPDHGSPGDALLDDAAAEIGIDQALPGAPDGLSQCGILQSHVVGGPLVSQTRTAKNDDWSQIRSAWG